MKFAAIVGDDHVIPMWRMGQIHQVHDAGSGWKSSSNSWWMVYGHRPGKPSGGNPVSLMASRLAAG